MSNAELTEGGSTLAGPRSCGANFGFGPDAGHPPRSGGVGGTVRAPRKRRAGGEDKKRASFEALDFGTQVRSRVTGPQRLPASPPSTRDPSSAWYAQSAGFGDETGDVVVARHEIIVAEHVGVRRR